MHRNRSEQIGSMGQMHEHSNRLGTNFFPWDEIWIYPFGNERELVIPMKLGQLISRPCNH